MDVKEELENVTSELKSLSHRCEGPIITAEIIRSKSIPRKMIKLEMIDPQELKTIFTFRRIHHDKRYIQKSIEEYYEKRKSLSNGSN